MLTLPSCVLILHPGHCLSTQFCPNVLCPSGQHGHSDFASFCFRSNSCSLVCVVSAEDILIVSDVELAMLLILGNIRNFDLKGLNGLFCHRFPMAFPLAMLI
jgi:hypothetical protein